MRYKYILFDIDNTLINFYESFCEAAKHVLTLGGHEITSNAVEEFFNCNDNTWFGFDLHHVERAEIRHDYHELYHRYLYDSIASSQVQMGLKGDAYSLLDCFIRELGACAVPTPNSVDVCRILSADHTLCIATNGLNDVQSGKITAFIPYMSHIYISESVGRIKPEPEYFDYIIQDLGCDRSECLMVGDSLPNDIAGANGAGIASCHYAIPRHGTSPNYDPDMQVEPTYRITDFRELLEIV